MEEARASDTADASEVIISSARIQRRVAELAREIAGDSGGGELTVIGVLEGAIFLLADLVRQLPMPVRLLTVGVRSYRHAEPGPLEFTQRIQTDLAGRDVLIVDDILDTGATLQAVAADVADHGPARCRTCVLSRKPIRDRGVFPDYVGFEVPDVFLVGYGLDLDGRFRNLPDIRACVASGEASP